MTSKGFKYTTEVLSMLFIDFTKFINLSLKIQMLCSSLSHSIFEKEKKKKNKKKKKKKIKKKIMSFFESLGDSIEEGFADASP